jgi:hypothetical protein
MPSKLSIASRTLSTTLTAVFCFSSIVPAFADSAQKREGQAAQNKGLIDSIQRVLRGERVCLGPICVNSGEITEALLKEQLRDIAQNNAPITVSSDDLYSVTESLPGSSFQPKLLDLSSVSPDSSIPAGDYIIPVQVFCLQRRASSPSGHRYRLGRYKGKMQGGLADLNRAAATTDVPHNELQGLSWAIQSGMTYDEMPSDMKAISDRLIPQHRSSLNDQELLEKIESIWEQASRFINLPSFNSFLTSELGEIGETIVAYREFRDRITSRGEDWRNLSDAFIIDDGRQGAGDILNTPWSEIREGVYARFLTSGNADDIGLLAIRIDGSSASSSTHERFISNKQNVDPNTYENNGVVPPPPPEGNNYNEEDLDAEEDSFAIPAEEISDLISETAALPEGDDSIQPLGMAPASDESWLSQIGDLIQEFVDFASDPLPEWENIRPYLTGASLGGLCVSLGGAAATVAGAAGTTSGIATGVGAAGAAAPVVMGGITLFGLCALAGYNATQPILMGNSGTPGNNQAQNKQFNDAVREIERKIGRRLTPDEKRQLHDAISGQNYGYHEIVEEGLLMFGQ